MADPKKISTTYAELRDDDLLEDKSGNRWHVSGVSEYADDPSSDVGFWLGDARTKVRMHHMTKPRTSPCTVHRTPTAADDLATLEAGSNLPDPSSALPRSTDGGADLTTSAAKGAVTLGPSMTPAGTGEPDPTPGASAAPSSTPAPAAATSTATTGEAEALLVASGVDPSSAHDAAVKAVELGLGATVEAEVSDAEVDAARRATDDEPVVVELFETMTDLEQKSHLFVLHGVFADDLDDRKARADQHAKAHSDRAQGKLKGRHTPHIHAPKEATA